ncbi:hypothetical protein D3C81_2011520 [compost metagenome]
MAGYPEGDPGDYGAADQGAGVYQYYTGILVRSPASRAAPGASQAFRTGFHAIYIRDYGTAFH